MRVFREIQRLHLTQLLRGLFLSIVLFFSTSAWAPVSADENFNISLVSSYTIQNNGSATIEQQFTLTNKTPTLYASQYAIEVGSNKIQNVKVFDKNGPIPANIINTDKKTSIAISFEDVIVGEGKKRQFTVQFESPDIAITSGNVVEVYIPRFSDLARYDSYKVEVKVPQRFGEPARMNPQADKITTQNGYTVLEFSNLGDHGITALFGEKQFYDFTLRYHLENSTASIGLAQIALPPDTAYQKVQYLNIDPRPRQLERDADGNWIATYEVNAGKETEVLLSGKVTVFLIPQADFPEISPTSSLTAAQKFWPVGNLQITSLVQQHNTPRQIYDYVVTTLTYNFAKVNGPVTRLGATEALAQPLQAACQEFTDLFITMARAAGIPARRVTGYAYTENSRLRPLSLVDDVLHAWPEYYDQQAGHWIAVDPTWGNTTGGLDYFSQLDFNHVAFAINGVSDSLPYPAGSYKRVNQKTKDVEVNFSKEEALPPLTVTYKLTQKSFWLAPFKNEYEVTLTNETGVAWYNLPLIAQADLATVQVAQLPNTLPVLLPYQTIKLPLQLKGADWLRRRPVTLTLSLHGISSTHEVRTGLKILETIKSIPINPLGLGIGLVIIALVTGGLLVFRRKR